MSIVALTIGILLVVLSTSYILASASCVPMMALLACVCACVCACVVCGMCVCMCAYVFVCVYVCMCEERRGGVTGQEMTKW